MSEHDVVARIAEATGWPESNIRMVLDALRPGDTLTNGLVAVLEVDPSELSEIAADIRAGRKSPNEARFVYRLPPVEDSEDKP